MEANDKKGGQRGHKTRRAFWSFHYGRSEIFEKPHWRVSWGIIINQITTSLRCSCIPYMVQAPEILQLKPILFYLLWCLQVLGSNVFISEHDGDENGVDNSYSFDSVDDACLLYCERFMEFLIDLLSQLPTRRYAAVSISQFFSLYFVKFGYYMFFNFTH